MNRTQLDFVTLEEAEKTGAFALRERLFHHAGERTDEDSSPHCLHLVARNGDHAAGYGKLLVDGEAARIKQICINPDIQRSGLGSQILERLIDRARDEGVSTVWLLARFTALGFYRKYDFTEIGPVMRSEDSAAPHRRMELQLKR